MPLLCCFLLYVRQLSRPLDRLFWPIPIPKAKERKPLLPVRKLSCQIDGHL